MNTYIILGKFENLYSIKYIVEICLEVPNNFLF